MFLDQALLSNQTLSFIITFNYSVNSSPKKLSRSFTREALQHLCRPIILDVALEKAASKEPDYGGVVCCRD